MNNKDFVFDSREPLPQDIVIKSAGNHLYNIGLTQFSLTKQNNRKFYFNPLFVFTINNILIVITIFMIILKDQQYFYIHLIFGNFFHLMKIRTYSNITQFLLIYWSQYDSSYNFNLLNHAKLLFSWSTLLQRFIGPFLSFALPLYAFIKKHTFHQLLITIPGTVVFAFRLTLLKFLGKF
jgi:hypothetical protein